ncbi:MAG: galactosyldiacylglycerol synthase [Acidobacteria bacterium]|nr:galactosyldiacylglycerol synthase [Acidobacteriota bacterium]
MRKLEFMFFDAGGGHRSAATALKNIVEEQQRPWRVRLVNLQEVLREIDIFRKATGISLEEIYNHMLKRGWTLGAKYLLPVMHGIIRQSHTKEVRLLEQFWRADPPDLLVSLIPNFNRALFAGIRAVNPRAPMVTIITDFADYPPHFWLEPQDQYVICGTEKAVGQARAMSIPPEKVFLTSGMILRPSFYQPFTEERAAAREKLGLLPHTPTGIVLFGGQGASVMVDIARRVQRVRRDVQFIFICGRNQKLEDKLREMPTRVPFHIAGFTQEVPRYMHLSDFFIGKPGPGSISEAVATGLPVMVVRNAWTLPQERYNADWVIEKDIGLALRNFKNVARAVEEMLEPATLKRFRANAARIENRAVFEIPGILEQILEKHT